MNGTVFFLSIFDLIIEIKAALQIIEVILIKNETNIMN